ncbi:acyltransferase [Methylobacterium sp. PvR107]|uniref:acyltransferase family protein n=1 Tax=Methylobacterium sp. PvR107 TaxID=2806597 RepID=UPI001AE47477|nr:acyltransferase [Methylobacterium sp. PvR107]MBP1179163.1 peptidoglycan/LPS O-acetylase OafA/YrhL [Methylobacterium sp. PvR107]
MSVPTIAAALDGRRNGFTGLRLALAVAVVVSHAFSVATGAAGDEPLARLTGYTLGEHAVNGFFAVSGFLVTMSCDRRGIRDYALARSLRILPGLVAATLVVSLGLGAAMTRLPVSDYWREPGLWSFIRGTLTTFKSNAALPGVFEANPYRAPLGTVWTLKYEVLCYLGVLAAALCGLLRRRWSALAIVAGLALALSILTGLRGADLPKGTETALRLPLIFAAGACLYLWRERLRISTAALACLAFGAFALARTPAYPALLFLAEAYGVVWLALGPLARGLFDPPADLSYGIYLYGWPIQQALHARWPEMSGPALLAPALAATLPVAALSWYGIERPALALKARALGRRRLGTIEPAGP